MLVTATHQSGQDVMVSFDKEALKQISSVANHPTLSNEANWKTVSIIFKHTSSGKRITSGFKNNFTKTDNVKLKANMSSGEVYELHKIIISGTNRQPSLSIKRSQIANASSMDLTLGGAAINVTLSTTAISAQTGVPFNVTATFSASVTGFTHADLALTNASISNFSGSGSVYTFEVVPNSNGPIAISVPQNVVSQGNVVSNSINLTSSSASSPTISISSDVSSTQIQGAFNVVTIFSSETISGFSLSDISVTNGTASNFVNNTASYRYIKMSSKDSWTTGNTVGASTSLSDVSFKWNNVNQNISGIASITYLNNPTYTGNLINNSIESSNGSDIRYWTLANNTFTDLFVIDLGAAYPVQTIRLGPQGGSNYIYNAPRTFKVYGSNDNSTWTEILSVAQVVKSWTRGVYNDFNLSAPKSNVATFTVTPQTTGINTTVKIPENCIDGGNNPSPTLSYEYV